MRSRWVSISLFPVLSMTFLRRPSPSCKVRKLALSSKSPRRGRRAAQFRDPLRIDTFSCGLAGLLGLGPAFGGAEEAVQPVFELDQESAPPRRDVPCWVDGRCDGGNRDRPSCLTTPPSPRPCRADEPPLIAAGSADLCKGSCGFPETLMAAYRSIVENRTVELPLPSGENPLVGR